MHPFRSSFDCFSPLPRRLSWPLSRSRLRPLQQWLLTSLLLLAAVTLSGCDGGMKAETEQRAERAATQLSALSSALEQGQVRNAQLINQYADLLAADKPKLKPLLDTLRQDATVKGPLFSNLQQRLDILRNQPDAFATPAERLEEAIALGEAVDVNAYNDMLSDPLNVIADLSEGSLPRVNAISKAQSLAANSAEDLGAGSQLVGNPNYGQWTTGSNGMSFWEWYGMYALFSNLTSPIRYDRWAGNRDYSYYQDYGRNTYSSKTQRASESKAYERTRKQFGSNSQRFDSAYSKSRTGASAVSSQSRSNQTRLKSSTSSRFKSNLSSGSSNTSRKTSGTSSFRNSGSKTSRGVSRGK